MASAAPRSLDVMDKAQRIASRVARLQAINWPDHLRPTLAAMITSSVQLATFEPVPYRGFRIQPIDHSVQPFWLEARCVTEGFIAISDVLGHCMPGAVWFYTVEEAKKAVDVFLDLNLDLGPLTSKRNTAAHAQAVQEFHRRLRSACEQENRHALVTRPCGDDDDATKALLLSEWLPTGDGGDGSDNCPCCSADRSSLSHFTGCVHDVALDKAGYRTQKQRDDARARIHPEVMGQILAARSTTKAP